MAATVRKRPLKTDTRPLDSLVAEITDSLNRLKCVEVRQAGSRLGDLSLLLSVYDEPKWMSILYNYLVREEEKSNWYSFIGKRYWTVGNKLYYGWVIILKSEDLDATVLAVRKLLSAALEATASSVPITPKDTFNVSAPVSRVTTTAQKAPVSDEPENLPLSFPVVASHQAMIERRVRPSSSRGE